MRAIVVGAVCLVFGLGATAPADEATAAAAFEKLGGSITRYDAAPGKPVIAVHLDGTRVTDADLKGLKAFKELDRLKLDKTDVGNAGLKEIEGLANLRWLGLDYTKVTDDGLKSVAALAGLKRLSLQRAGVTNAGLKHLAGMKEMEVLVLTGTKVTDDGLDALKGLARLQELYLYQTEVTEAGLAKVREALPKCRCYR